MAMSALAILLRQVRVHSISEFSSVSSVDTVSRRHDPYRILCEWMNMQVGLAEGQAKHSSLDLHVAADSGFGGR